MTLKTCLTNQLRRKSNFYLRQYEKNKSAYTSKVMTYAKYYKRIMLRNIRYYIK